MYLIYNKFFLYINNLKLLILISNFIKYFSNLFFYNFYRRILLFGIFKKNIIIFNIIGSLEISFFLNFFYFKKIFDIYILLGFIFKNKTFHFEILSLNVYFSLFKFSDYLNIPFVNFLLIFNNKFNYLSKIVKINDINLKIFLKFLNFLFFLKNFF